jgi:hypothetical protein
MNKDVKNEQKFVPKVERKNNVDSLDEANKISDSLTDLLTGIVVIVDDNLGDGKDKMNEVLDSLKVIGFPVVAFKSMPTEEVKHFKNPAFVVLDWELVDFTKIGAEAKADYISENIEFIEKLQEITFCPIFIFSNIDSEIIIQKLEDVDLYKRDALNNIFVQSKADVNTQEKIISIIERWYKANPSIYLMTKWKNSITMAETELYWDFFKLAPIWPSVIAKAFDYDGTDKNFEFGSFLNKNLMSRFDLLDLDSEIILKNFEDVTRAEIRKVLEGERFYSRKLPDKPRFGDLFKEENENDKGDKVNTYLLNIRPDCDIVRVSNPNLYMLKGRVVDENRINAVDEKGIPLHDAIFFQNGNFIEKANSTYILPIDGGKMIEFRFNELKTPTWKEKKDKRIGSILPPYITMISQRYSYYLQRQGLPGKPNEIF